MAAFVFGLALLAPGAASASFPGANGPILFTATAPGSPSTDVWAVAPDGGGLVNLTDLPGGPGEGRDPSVSGDGSLVAFATGPAGDSEIWTMAADGSAAVRVTTPNGAIDDMPALSPDGSRIAFRSDRDGGEDIWTMAADGSGATPLLTQPGADREPQFAADGSALATSSELGGDFTIVALPATGGPYGAVVAAPSSDPLDEPRVVTDYGVGEDERSPAIKPDVSRVAYSIAPGGGGPADIEDVFFNGTDFLPIAADPATSESQPAFSPDGTKLAFVTPGGLMVAASGGANPTPLATGQASAPADPDWAVRATGDGAAPETEITKRPRNRSARRTARYRFRSSAPGASFECKLDRAKFKPCDSPRRYKRLKPKRHRFRVRAIDLAGNVDPSPATDRFRIVRRG